ncbi:cannabinoid receptor 2-like [Branchiostoma lanceolatum]|uniref:cannabinoid receptor 2-like n=1 Tax=Branchiostoma lanceolatum TaxID=7740 RepID=UPI0034563E58
MSNNSSAAMLGPSELYHADPFECYAWHILQQNMSYDEAVDICSWYEEAPLSKVVTVLYVLVGVTIVLCNIIVLWGIIAKQELLQPMYFYVANLAVTDLLAGAMILWHVHDNVNSYKPFNVLLLRNVTMYSQFMSASALNLLTMDRFVAVKYPIFYYSHATNARRSAGIAIVCSWVVLALVLFSTVMGWNCLEEPNLRHGHCIGVLPLEYIIFTASLALLLIITLLSVNIIVYKAVKQRQTMKQRKQREFFKPSVANCQKRKGKQQCVMEHIKGFQSSIVQKTRTVMIFTIVAGVFWLLGLIVLSVKFILQKTYPDKDMYKQVMHWAVLVFCLNSVVNPLAGIVRLTDLREAIGQQFYRFLPGFCTRTCRPKSAEEKKRSKQNDTKEQKQMVETEMHANITSGLSVHVRGQNNLVLDTAV